MRKVSSAKILIIDSDKFDYYQSIGYEDEIYPIFSEEIDNGLFEFYFARNLSEASTQIQLIKPDLLISEIALTPNLLDSRLDVCLSNKFSYGFKIFEILNQLNCSSIPVIFWSTLGDEQEYISKTEALGAFACLASDLKSAKKLNKVCHKALKI